MANWPTRSEVKLSEPAVREIDLFVSRLDAVASIIEVSKELVSTLEPSKLIREVSDKVGIAPPEVRTIFNVLENLFGAKEDLGSADRVMLQVKKGLPPEVRTRFEDKQSEIVAAIDSYDRENPISLSFKAQRLTYLHDKLFHDAEVVTDARPIFDPSGTKIIEFVVTHELVLTSYSNEEFTREHFSLDNADLLMISKACDRALLKSKTIKETLKENCKVEVLRDDAGD